MNVIKGLLYTIVIAFWLGVIYLMFLEALYEIHKLVTPEMLKFREFRDKAMIKYILDNNLIEKAYQEVKKEENHT